MKAFRVFWKPNTQANAIVIAKDFDDCLRIAKTYGEVRDVSTESDNVITEPKPEQQFVVSA